MSAITRRLASCPDHQTGGPRSADRGNLATFRCGVGEGEPWALACARGGRITGDTSSFDFVFTLTARPLLRLAGVSPTTTGVDLTPTRLLIRYGHWRISLLRANIRTATVTGPFSPWKALGPRISLADQGLTLGTNSNRGVCLTLLHPIAVLLPGWLLRHPNITLTVARPEELAALLTPEAAEPELDAGRRGVQ